MGFFEEVAGFVVLRFEGVHLGLKKVRYVSSRDTSE